MGWSREWRCSGKADARAPSGCPGGAPGTVSLGTRWGTGDSPEAPPHEARTPVTILPAHLPVPTEAEQAVVEQPQEGRLRTSLSRWELRPSNMPSKLPGAWYPLRFLSRASHLLLQHPRARSAKERGGLCLRATHPQSSPSQRQPMCLTNSSTPHPGAPTTKGLWRQPLAPALQMLAKMDPCAIAEPLSWMPACCSCRAGRQQWWPS